MKYDDLLFISTQLDIKEEWVVAVSARAASVCVRC